MSENILPFRKPARRDADGVLHVPPPDCEGAVYVFYELMAKRQRKKRWFIVTQYCDYTSDIEDGPADWRTAMFLARVRARKFGFRVVDLSGGESAADGEG